MKPFLLLILLATFTIACSSSQTAEEEKTAQSTPKATEASKPQEAPQKSSGEDQYKLVLRHVDNRVVIYINDSTIFDTGDLPGGPYEREIDLTEYVKTEKTDMKVELYNSNPPDETMRPGWMIVYDIFVNEELAEFVSEKRNESKVGIVFTESYDLSDIW